MSRNAVTSDTIPEVVETPTLRSIEILDDALDRVSALDFEIPNPFVNHAPMACEALAALGLDSVIDEWVERYETLMGQAVPLVTPSWQLGFDWKEFLGDYRLLSEWMGYFDQAIDEQGWRTVIGVWLPRLMPGLAAALFHGVIRTSHAVRAIEVADTESRRAELARALGNWAVWFAPGQPVDQGDGCDDPQRSVLQAAAHGARCFVADPNIVNLHGVTGAMAVHLLAGHLATPDARAAVIQLQAEHRSLYRGAVPIAVAGEGYWNDQTVRDASKSYDAHQIKLVEACLRGFRFTGDPGFSRAAETVTSSAD
jgi:hypothetical protein